MIVKIFLQIVRFVAKHLPKIVSCCEAFHVYIFVLTSTAAFESTADMRDFVRCKIESLVANLTRDKPIEGKNVDRSRSMSQVSVLNLNLAVWILSIITPIIISFLAAKIVKYNLVIFVAQWSSNISY